MSDDEDPEDDLPSKGRVLSPEEIDQTIDALVKAVAMQPSMRFAVAGGVAMQAYGYPLPTKDVDSLADKTFGNQPYFEFFMPLSFGGKMYVSHQNEVKLDIIVRGDAYQALYEEALQHPVLHGGVPVLSPEYLGVIKFAAKRPKDLKALAWLLGVPDLLDAEKAGSIVHRTLGGQYALEVWNEYVRRIRLYWSRHRR
jgi:hypothetical protein